VIFLLADSSVEGIENPIGPSSEKGGGGPKMIRSVLDSDSEGGAPKIIGGEEEESEGGGAPKIIGSFCLVSDSSEGGGVKMMGLESCF
jgi:hypothetical protein